MKYRFYFFSLFLLVAFLANAGAKQPNIVFILTDDQGYGDVSAHGNPILKTPNLDQLHAQSVRFEDFHVSPTCAPTRSALFTGRHEFKNGITHTVLERERLSLDSITLAQVLRDAGYATGIFGKWHLGDEDAYLPTARGFNEMFIHGAGGIGQSYEGSCGDAPGNKYFNPAILHNGTFVKTTGYCTDVFFQQAREWMRSQVDSAQPFFAYIPTNAPHSPYIAKPEDAALYRDKVKNPQIANFYGMIHNIDQNIGTLLADLKSWGIERDTIVIFMNDNGSAIGHQTFTAGMRGSKGSPWLGGTRASSFWSWPGTWTPGSNKALTAHIDFFPTIAEIAQATVPDKAKKQIEGRSLLPLIKDPAATWPDRNLITHVGRWPKGTDPEKSKYSRAAIRNSRWSMVNTRDATTPGWQLFDLSNDYAQEKDIAADHPDVVKQLATAYDSWWAECLPLMVNEKANPPSFNAFAVRYWKQFGGEPSEKDRKRMKP